MDSLVCAKLSLLSYEDSKSTNESFQRHVDSIFKESSVGEYTYGSIQYYTFKDTINKKLFVVIRGTDTHSIIEQCRDVFVSLLFFRKKYKNNKYHFGYLYVGKMLYRHLKDDLHDAFDDGFDIIFTGHSMGGSIAKICAELFDKECYLYDFASPMVTLDKLSNENIKYHRSYVVYGDIVPSFPGSPYNEFHHNSLFILYDEPTKYQNVNKKNIVFNFIRTLFFGRFKSVLRLHSMKTYLKNIKRLERNESK